MKNERKICFGITGLLLILMATISVIAQDEYVWPTDPSAAWAAAGMGVFCVIALIIFIIAIVLAIWVYRDAEKRGGSGALWLIIVIFTGIIGLIIWLVIRPPIGGKKVEGQDRRCPNCGRVIPMDANICPYCGKEFGK